jgi:hypothetical protein
MLKLFHSRRTLVEETPLSHFVQKATAAEKRKIYNQVIQQASDEQRALIEIVQRKHSRNQAAA